MFRDVSFSVSFEGRRLSRGAGPLRWLHVDRPSSESGGKFRRSPPSSWRDASLLLTPEALALTTDLKPDLPEARQNMVPVKGCLSGYCDVFYLTIKTQAPQERERIELTGGKADAVNFCKTVPVMHSDSDWCCVVFP